MCEPVNPGGTACYAYIIKRSWKVIDKDYGIIGTGAEMTNNVAEYTALIQAMQKVKSLGLDNEKIVVRSDSRLVAEGMSKNWKIKAPRVLPLYTMAKMLASNMDITFEWIPREQNEETDGLCRLAYESTQK